MAPILLLTGLLAGWLGRLLLRRLSRGADVRPGWCEAGCGVLWGLLGLAVGISVSWLPVMLALSWFAVMLTATDLLHNRLPDALTLSAYPVFAVLLAVSGVSTLMRASVGAALFLCLHATVHFLAPHAMGGGDVKLAGSLGAVLGAVSWFALAVALVLAAVFTLGLRAVSLGRWRDHVPHGPGLLASTWLLAFLPGA
jgi:leader peptidase (prepilin peptidase) / N-methyltransferase